MKNNDHGTEMNGRMVRNGRFRLEHLVMTLRFLMLCAIINHQIYCDKLEGIKIPNQFETNNVSYWRSISHFKPSPGVSYGTILLTNDVEMRFKLICHNINKHSDGNEFENIFRIGRNGLNYGCDYHGSRYPALYIDTKLMKFEFAISDTDYCWRQYPFKSPCNECLSVQIGSIYYFKIQFNQTNVNIIYDHYSEDMEIIKQNEIIYDGNKKGRSNKNHLCHLQDIIISDPLNIAADVTLWDIEILSFDPGLHCKEIKHYASMHQEL
eukprot:828615_1